MTFRDTIALTPDRRASGAELPDYTGAARVSNLPCKINEIRGDETWRGRQLEARADYVIQLWHGESLNGLPTTDQVTVTGGWHANKTLHIAFVRFYDADHRKPPMLELFCREVV